MYFEIQYFYIKSDHILASPEYDHREIVKVNTRKQLEDYVKSLQDLYNNPFKKCDPPRYGFNYISNQGALKVSRRKSLINKDLTKK
jgi:hypothetical protein